MLKSWKCWVVVVVVGIGLGVGAGWVTQRMWGNYHADRLLSTDRKTQSAALAYWGVWDSNKTQRLFNKSPVMRAVNRRLPETSDGVLIGFLGKFHFQRYVDSPLMPNMRPALHDLLERNSSRAMQYRADSKYATLAFSYSINGMYQEMEPHILRMVRSGDPQLRGSILAQSMSLLGAKGEPVVASMLDDTDPDIARRAWLAMAFIDPVGGYAGNWRDAADGVAEGILYAAIMTADRPEMVLEQIDNDADPSARFAWVRPFLDRAVEMRRGKPAGRGDLSAEADTIIREEFLFESEVGRPPEGTEQQWRRAIVSELIDQFARGSKDYESALRWILEDIPLPEVSDMTERQRKFAGELAGAWWLLHDESYAFDEEAKVFRRKTQNEKGPE